MLGLFRNYEDGDDDVLSDNLTRGNVSVISFILDSPDMLEIDARILIRYEAILGLLDAFRTLLVDIGI